MTTLLGALAAICSTASFSPQAWKIIKTRNMEGISVRMYILTVTGFALWLVYGFATAAWPLMVSNGLCLLLSAFILVMKVLSKRKRDQIADAIDPTT